MVNRACPKCNIVYHMISDSVFDPICKKCGGVVVAYFESDFYSITVKPNVKHDFRWTSNCPRPEDIDPNYEPVDHRKAS